MSDRYKPLTLAELDTLELPEREWIVDGLLATGAFVLLAAREKSGKSLMLADLCCCVALGETFLDKAVAPGPVALIPAEENLRDIRDRLHTRLAGQTGPLYVLAVDGSTDETFSLEDPASLMKLRQMILDYELTLVALDPMRELHTLRESDSDMMSGLMRPLRQIAHETNCTIVLAHHMNKGGNFRGDTSIKASVDDEWSFRRSDDAESTDAPRGTLMIDGRSGARRRLGIQLGDQLRWQASDIVEVGKANTRDAVLAYLRQANTWKDAEAIATATGKAKKTVQNAISELLRAQPSPIVKQGDGTKGSPCEYCIADPTYWPDGDGNGDVTETQAPRNGPAEMVPDSQPLKSTGTGESSYRNRTTVPDPSGNNGTQNGKHAASDEMNPSSRRPSGGGNWAPSAGQADVLVGQRRCVECRAPAVSNSFYCGKHGGRLNNPAGAIDAEPTSEPEMEDWEV